MCPRRRQSTYRQELPSSSETSPSFQSFWKPELRHRKSRPDLRLLLPPRHRYLCRLGTQPPEYSLGCRAVEKALDRKRVQGRTKLCAKSAHKEGGGPRVQLHRHRGQPLRPHHRNYSSSSSQLRDLQTFLHWLDPGNAGSTSKNQPTGAWCLIRVDSCVAHLQGRSQLWPILLRVREVAPDQILHQGPVGPNPSVLGVRLEVHFRVPLMQVQCHQKQLGRARPNNADERKASLSACR